MTFEFNLSQYFSVSEQPHWICRVFDESNKYMLPKQWGGGAQRPILNADEPKKTGAHGLKARPKPTVLVLQYGVQVNLHLPYLLGITNLKIV